MEVHVEIAESRRYSEALVDAIKRVSGLNPSKIAPANLSREVSGCHFGTATERWCMLLAFLGLIVVKKDSRCNHPSRELGTSKTLLL